MKLFVQIFNWIDGKYTAETGARGYQLSKHEITQKVYQNQQIEAWGEISIGLIHEALQKLEASAQVNSERVTC